MNCESDSIVSEKTDVVELLKSDEPTKICAPMVRYSKLPFRLLVQKYACDLAYTPMIVADSFIRSEKYRNVELVTSEIDHPLIAQFAANNAEDFASAAEIAYPYVDGVDLNCGCPQRRAMNEGYGARLLKTPEKLVDFVRHTRNRISDTKFSVSTKIRIHENVRDTVNLCQGLEKIGVSFIAIHGRTTKERRQPVHYDVIKLIKDSVSIPVVANGGVTSLPFLQKIYDVTGCNGVMAAQGLLNNPALFDGYQHTPIKCVQDWLDITSSLDTHFTCFHNHLIYMLAKVLRRADKQVFNTLKSKDSVINYLQKYLNGEEELSKR